MATEWQRVRSYRNVEQALAEIEREMNVRSRCFPDWIAAGKVNRIDAIDRLDRMATAFELVKLICEDDGARMAYDEVLAARNKPAPEVPA